MSVITRGRKTKLANICEDDSGGRGRGREGKTVCRWNALFGSFLVRRKYYFAAKRMAAPVCGNQRAEESDIKAGDVPNVAAKFRFQNDTRASFSCREESDTTEV